jgi:hypothetical protein
VVYQEVDFAMCPVVHASAAFSSYSKAHGNLAKLVALVLAYYTLYCISKCAILQKSKEKNKNVIFNLTDVVARSRGRFSI